MARGNIEKKMGRHRNTARVGALAGGVVVARLEICDLPPGEQRDELIAETSLAVAEMTGLSTRMDRGGASRRTACERIMQACFAQTEALREATV